MLTSLISLHSKRLSRAFSSTTVQKHQFFGFIMVLYKRDPAPPGKPGMLQYTGSQRVGHDWAGEQLPRERTPPAWQRMKTEGEEMGRQQMHWNSSMKMNVSEAEGMLAARRFCLPSCLEPQKKKPGTLTITSRHIFISQASWLCHQRTPACPVAANWRIFHSEPVAASRGWAGAARPIVKDTKEAIAVVWGANAEGL